jgi:hypothetical protein
MKFLFAFVLQVFLLALNMSAAAQRSYTFEEACRNAGMTTGACAPKSQQPQSPSCVKLGGNAFHAEKSPTPDNCINTTLSPSGDVEIFVEMIGLPNIPKVNELKLTIRRSSGVPNAFALFPEAYLVLAHEAGHHFCSHTLPGFLGNPKEKELEADRFSGASIRRFEVYHGRLFISAALAAAERLYSEQGSRTHPPRSARLSAVMLGYNDGSPCGNLAQGIKGFSPNPR